MYRLLIIAVILLPFLVKAQVYEFQTPEKLPPTINTDAEEGMPLLSSDGKMLFFTRSLYIENEGGKYSGDDVWISERQGVDWKRADNRKVDLNNKNSNAVIGMNAVGDILYLMNVTSQKKIEGIFFSKKLNNVWSKLELIPIRDIESSGFVSFYVSPDFDVIFISMNRKDSRGEEDMYVSIKGTSGGWSTPKNLGPTINTVGFEISPFLSKDKKRLYFSSNGHPGLGDGDIFYSDRLYDSWETWTTPRNLGQPINTKSYEGGFSLYGDSIAFVASNRLGKLSDIYKSKCKIVGEVVQSGPQYLSKSEVLALIPQNVSLDFPFGKGITALTASQQELVFFIANKILLSTDIKVQIIAPRDRDSSDARIKNITATLEKGGIDNARILATKSSDNKDGNLDVVVLRLFR
jgi:hypothetical protein